jgi:hypothetical protein
MSTRSGIFKTRLMACTIAVALLSAVGWSYMQLAETRASEAAAAQDLADCRALTARIELLRRRPSVAGAQQLGAADLSRRIESAARAADFADGSVERIEPEPARRVGETNYREVPTQVRLRRVTLRQVFTFLHALSADPSQPANDAQQCILRVRDIRLSAPRGEEIGDRWTVESTLTYTVYAPKGKDESAGASTGVVAER